MPKVTVTVGDAAGNQTSAQASVAILAAPVVSFGCSNGNYAAFETALGGGRVLEAKRLYEQSTAPSTWEVPLVSVRAVSDTLLYDAASLAAAHAKLKTFPLRPIVNYDGEMERTAGQTAAQYIARHRALYDACHDVADVAWNPMAWSFRPGVTPDARQYYPGDAYVDIIAVDGYANNAALPYSTPEVVFKDGLAFARAHGKSFAIFEVGVRTDTAGAKEADYAAWITALHSYLKQIPELAMVLYFNSAAGTYPHRIDSYPLAMAAFAAMMDEMG